jgi:hypothetical protein
MSSTSGRDELDEGGVEELGAEDHGWEDEDGGEELDEAAAMSSTGGGGDELDESGVDEPEDEDGGEELEEATVMTSTGGGDELDEGRGWAHGMAMVRSNGWICDGVGELLEAPSEPRKRGPRCGTDADLRITCWR